MAVKTLDAEKVGRAVCERGCEAYDRRRWSSREGKDIILFELDSTWGGVSKYC